MKIYAGFFSLIIIIADTILSTVAAQKLAHSSPLDFRKLMVDNLIANIQYSIR